ncbi:MAG: bacillithiol system redox-active protein YtxJ [Clostridia bacterium]|nr:bacillithiol system redox-active protein YtxJ [Clostridia bacterium]
MIEELRDATDFERALVLSRQAPVLLFKHSTRCPISAAAHRAFTAFAGEAAATAGARCFLVDVIQCRALSQEIARRTGVTHESPQALLLVNGRCVWHASHYDITQESLSTALTG